jgi:hypothetical protein
MTVSLCSPLNDREEHQLEPQGRRAGEGSGFRQPGTRHLPWLWHEASNEAVRSLPVRVWRARRVRDDAMINADQPIPRFREFPDRAFTPFDEDERRLLRRYVQQAEDLKGCGFWKGDRKLQLTIQGKQGRTCLRSSNIPARISCAPSLWFSGPSTCQTNLRISSVSVTCSLVMRRREAAMLQRKR